MRGIDLQVGCLDLSSWPGMRRTLHRKGTQTSDNLPGDRAGRPLLGADLLPQLAKGRKERRTSNSEGNYLILSDGGLDSFDTERAAEVRAALSGEFLGNPSGREDGPVRWPMALKHMVFGIAIAALAVAVGMTIGLVF